MGPDGKWSLKLNSTFYIGEPVKELPRFSSLLVVLGAPQEGEFFQPSSLSTGGNITHGCPRPLHKLKSANSRAGLQPSSKKEASQKNVRVRRPQADSWPSSNELKQEEDPQQPGARLRPMPSTFSMAWQPRRISKDTPSWLGPLHFV